MGQNKSKRSEISRTKRIISNSFFPIIGVLVASLLVRLYFFDPNIPVVNDGIDYFQYANYIAKYWELPVEYSLDNYGWSLFLSSIFKLFNFDTAIQLMQIQKISSIILSTLTTIPIYFLCKKFVKREFALVGAIIFSLEPRLIENSLLGITESLYILLVTISLLFFLSNSKKFVYAAFAISAISTIVRSEGIFLFFAISIMFFIQNRHDKLVIPKYIPAILIFFIVLGPMMMYQSDIRGDDRVFSRIEMGIKYGNNEGVSFLIEGIINFVKFFAWNTIPIFVIFLPLGFFIFLKKIDHKKLTILISGLCMALPALYAYSIPALDTRYLYPLYPLLCIIAIFSFEPLVKKIQGKIEIKILVGIIFGIIIILSFSFLQYDRIDLQHEKEALSISEIIFEKIDNVNSYYPEDRYLKAVEIIKKFPNIDFPMSYTKEIFNISNFNTLEDFIKHNPKVTHLVIDDNINRPQFLKELFNDDKKFTCLKKIYDSSDSGFSYKLKVYEIDYKLFTNCFD